MSFVRKTVSMNEDVHDKLNEIRAKRILKGENVSFTAIVNEYLKRGMKK